jgi:hypothetical protein
MNSKPRRNILLALLLAAALHPHTARPEAILQYFNTSWREITEKMPEISEAGYTALWLPPPTKASGGLSVGYDLWDPFDLGGKEQRGTVSTRYGTESELLHLVKIAHRFGIRVYFDNIMNHRAFDIPGYNEETPVDIYPGLLPEDFHLRVTEDGFYRKWDNTRDWGSSWQVQNLGLADLIDIAHETPNANFGSSEGSTHPKLSFVRDATRPWQYDRAPNGDYVGFGPGNGLTAEIVASNPSFYKEDVGAYLIRAARWLMDRTKADGLRLDAVKHVPSYFFGQQSGGGRDSSNAGYLGGVQWQFNMSRGYSDWGNHRDSLFNHEQGRDDAFVFGEHLGSPPGYAEYIESGMRLVDAPLHREMNSRLGNPGSGLSGLDSPGWSGNASFNDSTGVAFAQSHDDDFANRRELQHAYYLTRRGVANVYTDGYRKAGTLGESGGAFPRHANNPFLGQFGDPKLPHLLSLREAFARGSQIPQWSDSDVVAYERRDKRENLSMDDANGTVMLFMLNDNYSSGQARPIQTSFPSVAGGSDSYLHNYSTFGGGFYVWASDIASGRVTIPPGGYFAFSWKNPDSSPLWTVGGGSPITIMQSGTPVGRVRVTRKDGPDGDPQFNPYGLPNRGYPEDTTPVPYTYQTTLPRVTDPLNLTFLLFSDGSTENVQMKLNGGIDINSQMGPSFGPQSGDKRDNPPAWSTDTFLGYEQARFVRRQHPEKFAAALSSRNKIGSAGAETYHRTASGTFTIVPGPAGANQTLDTMGGTTASFVFHDPTGVVSSDSPSSPGSGSLQFSAGPSNSTVWVKTSNVGPGYRAHLYYTLDGSNPEGAGGYGVGTTKVAPMSYRHTSDSGSGNWWSTSDLPTPPTGTEMRYKVAVFRDQDGSFPVGSVWPSWQGEIDRKLRMMTVFEVAGLNAKTVVHYPHNDYSEQATGLSDGWHVIRARAYLNRGNGSQRHAAIYKTFTQPFYLDTETPRGEIIFPDSEGATISGQDYEFVVRTDQTVEEVWYNISDGSSSNDDLATGRWSGNGIGGEPFTDSNRNSVKDPQEPFEDLNENGIYDANLGDSWARATRVSSPTTDHPLTSEWRFAYSQVPPSGTATARVRLVEASSAPRKSWQPATTDQSGNFTTLSRTISTRGPATRVFVAWPPADGETVGEGYVAKIYFSKALTPGWTETAVKSAFTVRLQNAESGRTDGGTPQPRDTYGVVWNETGEYHALSISLPNMYNGNPDWLHGIIVDFLNPGVSSARATRLVKSEPVPPPPRVEIVEPQEIGSDGRPLEITLPALASPSPSDRQIGVIVRTDGPASEVSLSMSFDFSPPEFSGSIQLRPPTETSPNPRTDGDTLVHEFIWSAAIEGRYRIRATVSKNGRTNSATRNGTVAFRQSVPIDSTGDSDNDGVPDSTETSQVPLPTRNDETWSNAEVHIWRLSGRSDPAVIDTDGGGLPDGLQLGIEWPIIPAATDLSADTDGDGIPNFVPDLDPPIFNTSDRPGYQQRLSRTDQIGGSMTDPFRPDDDDDGLSDGREDLNRNGRVDIAITGASGKAQSIIKHPDIPTVRNSSAVASADLPAQSRFLETDPNNRDTDQDGLSDSQEDFNGNGRIDAFLLHQDGRRTPVDYTSTSSPHYKYNLVPDQAATLRPDGLRRDGRPHASIISRALDYAALFADYSAAGNGLLQSSGWPKILITETDPLSADTLGSGLPDGWKARYGLDPLDNGLYNFRNGEIGNPDNLPSADLTGDGVTNMDHYLAGTDPRSTQQPAPPGGVNKITIGPGPVVGVINGNTYHEEFSDWKSSDLVSLDEYHGDGYNSQSGDIYPAGDRWDSSRDIVAFYARDGGDPAAGGDGKVYFRLDFDDLLPFAETGHLDLYVAINHSPGTGERVLPDDLDTLTNMRWRTIVAVYDSSSSKVLVDTNPNLNSNNFGDAPSSTTGVVTHNQGSSSGVSSVYFNSELDAVEFSVPRSTIKSSGWSGSDFAQLNFQVYTTKDGTSNNPRGPGDLPGRSDLRDTVLDDGVVENNFFAQASREDILSSWMPFSSRSNPPPAATVLMLVEENQQLNTAGWIQSRINDNAGAGYYRLLESHRAFSAPLSLAITPTLASSIQWAVSDPDKSTPWKDGPLFNQTISDMASSGLIDLLSTTFSGHLMLHTPLNFDQRNVELSSQWLSSIYGVQPSRKVLYLPERTLNNSILDKVMSLGYTATFADQREHIEGWYGRTEALGKSGYKLNRASGTDMIVISDDLTSYRFAAQDGGTSTQLRRSLSRKSRHPDQEQVTVIISGLEDFRNPANAGGYDRNIRWMANRPWVKFTTASGVASSSWSRVLRPPAPSTPRSKNFVQYASLGSYENWYSGTSIREGLLSKRFEIRPGSPVPQPFGSMISSGVSHSAWSAISPFSLNSPVGRLSSAAAGASMFATAFHNQGTVDMRKFSSGEYINPPQSYESLADFSLRAQSSLRYAAVYARVNQWLNLPDISSTRSTSLEDVDLDGEPEYLLWNNRVFAVFERMGGRLTFAWLRDPKNKRIWQMVGNPIASRSFPDEREGTDNSSSGTTSAFKDWFAQPVSGTGSSPSDQLYSATAIPNGFRFSTTSIIKEITIAPGNDPKLEARYSLSGLQKLFIRHGLSPHLEDLLLNGQDNLRPEQLPNPRRINLTNDNGIDVVRAYTEVSPSAAINQAASDTSGTVYAVQPTVPRRSQPQIHQVEVELTGSQDQHTVTLAFDNGSDYIPPDPYRDFISVYFAPGSPTSQTSESADPDADGLTNYQEFILGSNPSAPDSHNPSGLSASLSGEQFSISFNTMEGRIYTVEYTENLSAQTSWTPLANQPIAGDGSRKTVLDPVENSRRKFYRVNVSLSQ